MCNFSRNCADLIENDDNATQFESLAPNLGTLEDIDNESLILNIFSLLGDSDGHAVQCTCKDFYLRFNHPDLLQKRHLLGDPSMKACRILSRVEEPAPAIAILFKFAECGNLQAMNL